MGGASRKTAKVHTGSNASIEYAAWQKYVVRSREFRVITVHPAGVRSWMSRLHSNPLPRPSARSTLPTDNSMDSLLAFRCTLRVADGNRQFERRSSPDCRRISPHPLCPSPRRFGEQINHALAVAAGRNDQRLFPVTLTYLLEVLVQRAKTISYESLDFCWRIRSPNSGRWPNSRYFPALSHSALPLRGPYLHGAPAV